MRLGPDAGCRAVGLDLGTTNACVAVASGREVAIVPDARGERVHPVEVALGPDGSLSAGEAARRLDPAAPRAAAF
ncbi:MAG TPA: Hsp70 family protein, partial [Polyangia bacterium]